MIVAPIAISAAFLGCNIIFGYDDLEIVESGSAGGPTVTVTGTGTGTGGQGGGGTACEVGQQDNDEDGTCSPACAAMTCSGNGDCVDTSGTATCTCQPGFTDPACSSCAVGYTGATCDACDVGFQDKDDDGTCLRECAAITCNGNGACDDSSGMTVCTCNPTFMGVVCETPCPTGTAGPTCEFSVVYGLNIPVSQDWNVQANVPYDIDDAATVGVFDRVAYRLILDTQEVWVEMDPFTANAAQLGVPTDWTHDVAVTNVLIRSTSPNQASVLTPVAGRVEMWGHCYSAGPNGVYDYDDDVSVAQQDCYGSLQVHLTTAPVLCFNSWANGGNLDIGIGPAPAGNPDWTFADNGATFTNRRLEVYVRE